MSDQDLTVGCFGKLPFWREYLEGGARSTASRALREWLRQGREMLVLETSSEDQPVTDKAFEAHLRVLLSLPGAEDLLVGIVRPSRDAGGRHAPFTVYARLSRRHYGKHYALLPSALGTVWDALDDAWNALHETPSRSAFDETCETFEVPAPVDVKQARGGYQGRQLDDAGKLFDRPALDALRNNMPDTLERIKKGAKRGVCVALPASEDVGEACFNASLWIDLVNRQFRLKRFDPSVFFDAREGLVGRQVYLKFGELDPLDYVQMLGDPAQVDSGEVVRPVEATPGVSGDPLEATYKQLLETVF
jgi:type VI secretion system ImpM family protein